MSPPLRGPRIDLITLCLVTALGLGACGGGDDEQATGSETEKETSATVPSLDAMLSCLKAQGLDAKDQSSSRGDAIGIDRPGGRTVISFEETEEEAKTLEGVADTQTGPGGEAFRQGTVVVSIPDDPAATGVDKPAIETCLAE